VCIFLAKKDFELKVACKMWVELTPSGRSAAVQLNFLFVSTSLFSTSKNAELNEEKKFTVTTLNCHDCHCRGRCEVVGFHCIVIIFCGAITILTCESGQ